METIIKAIVHPRKRGYDHEMITFMAKDKKIGSGYRGDDGEIKIEHCPNCGRENYAMSVHSGFCAWCSFNANEEGKIELI